MIDWVLYSAFCASSNFSMHGLLFVLNESCLTPVFHYEGTTKVSNGTEVLIFLLAFIGFIVAAVLSGFVVFTSETLVILILLHGFCHWFLHRYSRWFLSLFQKIPTFESSSHYLAYAFQCLYLYALRGKFPLCFQAWKHLRRVYKKFSHKHEAH